MGELQEEVKNEITRSTGSTRSRKAYTTRDAELAKDTEVVKKDAVIQSLKKRLHKEERHNRNLSKAPRGIKKFAEISMDGEVSRSK